jgi:hypothetical protein
MRRRSAAREGREAVGIGPLAVPPAVERQHSGGPPRRDEALERCRRPDGVVENEPSRLPRDDCGRHRLAQRPGGQETTVAAAALVEDEDLDVAAEREVLQPVVGDDGVDAVVGLQQGMGGGHAIAADDHRHARAPREKQRFVADVVRCVVRCHPPGHVVGRAAPAVATRDDARHAPRCTQRLDDREHGRRLAGAADEQVADDDHRHRQHGRFSPAAAVGRTAQPHERAV